MSGRVRGGSSTLLDINTIQHPECKLQDGADGCAGVQESDGEHLVDVAFGGPAVAKANADERFVKGQMKALRAIAPSQPDDTLQKVRERPTCRLRAGRPVLQASTSLYTTLSLSVRVSLSRWADVTRRATLSILLREAWPLPR